MKNYSENNLFTTEKIENLKIWNTRIKKIRLENNKWKLKQQSY